MSARQQQRAPARRGELPFSPEEYAGRLQAVRRGMEAAGIEVLLTTVPENIVYLTGYSTLGYFTYQMLVISLDRSPTAVRIDVFDVQGRRVRTLLDRTMTRGTHIVGWDSRDDRGRLVAAGAYFARLTVDGQDAGGKKLVVLH